MSSFATVTSSNMEISPVQVLFTPPGAGSPVDLGGTLGNVTVAAKIVKTSIKADQYGSSELDAFVSGLEITVTTELAEIKNKDLWKIIFPNATLVSGTSGFAGQKALDFVNAIGDSDLDNHAGLLTLHPLVAASSDHNTDHNFWKAAASAESQIVYGPSEQSKLKIVWKVYPDTSVSPARWYRFGDAALT